MVAFVRQYQYNFDMVPDRMQLQNMSKKGHRPKVERPGSPSGTLNDEKKMRTMIVDTLPVFYYERMVSYTPSSFADLVFAR